MIASLLPLLGSLVTLVLFIIKQHYTNKATDNTPLGLYESQDQRTNKEISKQDATGISTDVNAMLDRADRLRQLQGTRQ